MDVILVRYRNEYTGSEGPCLNLLTSTVKWTCLSINWLCPRFLFSRHLDRVVQTPSSCHRQYPGAFHLLSARNILSLSLWSLTTIAILTTLNSSLFAPQPFFNIPQTEKTHSSNNLLVGVPRAIFCSGIIPAYDVLPCACLDYDISLFMLPDSLDPLAAVPCHSSVTSIPIYRSLI